SLSSNANLYWDNTNSRLGLGTATPTAQLHTTGSIRFAGAGTPSAGRVLTSDASGNATWQDGTAHSHATLSQGTGIATFSYNGSSAATVSLTNTGVTAGTYGNSGANIPNITVDAQGRLTAASNRALTPGDIGAATSGHTHANLTFNNSGSGAASGTAYNGSTAYTISYNTIGAVGGSGAATRVAFWDGTNTLSSNANLYWDNTNSRLGLGTATPTAQLHTTGSIRFAGAGTPSAGRVLTSDASGNATWQDGTAHSHATLSQGTGIATFSYNGSSAATVSLTNTGVTAGTYGNSGANIPNITVDAQGRLTAASNRALTPGDIGAATSGHTHANLTFNNSGSGAASGTAYNGSTAYTISYNTIGAVGGSGAATRVAFWDGTNTLSSNANLYWDNTNSRLGVGTTTPSQSLHVQGNARVTGAYYDSNNLSGTTGQVLSSTGTGTVWTKAHTVQSATASVTEGNWYRIASNSGNRADATFTLRDQISAGGHSTLRFHAGINYGDAGGISFTLISHSQYSTPTFTKVRIIRNNTYDGAYLEVYCARSGTVSYDIFDNYQANGWTPENWTAGSIPTGWTAHEYEVARLFAVGGSDDILSLTRTGNFGLGVENPSVRLDVSGQTKLVNSTSPTLYIQNDANSFANHALRVNSQASDRAFIASNGGAYFAQNVGIGNSSPGQMLDVNGRIRIVSSQSELYQDANRLKIRSENTDGVAEFASYGLYLPRTGQTYNLYLAGKLKVGNNESGWIDINDANTRLLEGSNNALRMQTNSGYVELGPQNTSYSHFTTDRPRFYFNKGITVDEGLIGSYDENLQFQTSGTTRIWVLNTNGYVGINNAAPGEILDVTGNIRASGIAYWGNAGVRTETRDNAGLQGDAGARSGFFETSAPSPAANWPSGASSWWHLLDVRHSNNSNNYAMQFAGSFFDQRLFFRKTNNNPAQPWSEIVTTNTLNQNSVWALMGDFAYSPDDISGATVLSGDDVTANYTMPFSLIIDGVSYNTITISTNGWISFGNPGSSYYNNTSLPSASFSAPTIFPYWDDLVTNGNNIRYFTTGTAPNRAVVIDFECRTYSSNYNVRFQVTIHEGSGLINVQYRDEMNPSANGQSATIGFQLAGGGSAKAYPIIYNGKILDDNRDNSMGWSIAPVR
ncbi:MAG TPA: hypothetical protein PK285_04925, partial [Bacteroidales bacterium]|nr:hypothetical protein [Bacteroidales bacterium]